MKCFILILLFVFKSASITSIITDSLSVISKHDNRNDLTDDITITSQANRKQHNIICEHYLYNYTEIYCHFNVDFFIAFGCVMIFIAVLATDNRFIYLLEETVCPYIYIANCCLV